MKNKKLFNKFVKISFFVGVFAVTFASTSCALISEIINDSNSSKNTNYDDFSVVKQTEGDYSKFVYEDIEESKTYPITPSRGNVTILVVPVEFSDLSSFTSNDLKIIDSGFNGINDDNSNDYWESVKSFYYKSSNGMLNFTFEVADTYTPSFNSTKYLSLADNYGTENSYLLEDMVSKGIYKDGSKINLKNSKYDSNSDGYVDGIWLVHNEKSYNSVYKKLNFWAYTTSYGGSKYSYLGKYSSASILFLTDGSTSNYDYKEADSHIYIHETGHLLGLDDYYDYNSTTNKYSYSGGTDMMDLNIGDHNAFSKYALGWTKSKVITESTTVTLKPFSTSFDSLILPSGSYNGSAFSEYLIVEFYTNDGLYKLDSTYKYGGYSSSFPLFYSTRGLRIFHVDARLAKFYATYNSFNSSYTYKFGSYLSSDITSIPEYSFDSSTNSFEFTFIAHTNSIDDTSRNKDGLPLIELVTSRNTKLYGTANSSDRDLYTANKSDGYAFSASNQSKFFNDGKFNDGSEMNYKIKINDKSSSQIDITIEVE